MKVMCYDYDPNDKSCIDCGHQYPHNPTLSYNEGACNDSWFCHTSKNFNVRCKPVKKEKIESIFKKDIQRILDI